ncbi:MAG: potassium channel family protein [Candidatus Hodarchaeales archaeon]
MRLFFRSFLIVFGRLKFVLFYLFASIIFGALMFQLFYSSAFDPQFTGQFLDSILASISLMFAMEIYTFPYNGPIILKLLYILYPFLGLILVGIGIVEFSVVAFTFRNRMREWNKWMAKTMNNHTILVGLGNVGTRVLEELVTEKIPTVVITMESEKHSEFIEQMLTNPDVAVVFGDASEKKVLQEANITKARALLVVTNDDLVNFRIAVKAKEMNPNLRTVIRVFDQTFARKITDVFDIDAAISTSALTAKTIVARSFEDGIIQTFRSKKTGTDFHLIELSFKKKFEPITVEKLEEKYDITILAVNNIAHPEYNDKVESGSKVMLLGDIQALRRLKEDFC